MRNKESNGYENYRILMDLAKIFDAVPVSSAATILGVEPEIAEIIMYKTAKAYSAMYYDKKVLYSSMKAAGRSIKPMLVYTDVCLGAGKVLKCFKANEPHAVCTFYHPERGVIYRLYHVKSAMELSAAYDMAKEVPDEKVRRFVLMDDMKYVEQFDDVEIDVFAHVIPGGEVEYYER